MSLLRIKAMGVEVWTYSSSQSVSLDFGVGTWLQIPIIGFYYTGGF